MSMGMRQPQTLPAWAFAACLSTGAAHVPPCLLSPSPQAQPSNSWCPLPIRAQLMRPNALVPHHLNGREPSYLVVAGIVFTVVTGGAWYLPWSVRSVKLSGGARCCSLA